MKLEQLREIANRTTLGIRWSAADNFTDGKDMVSIMNHIDALLDVVEAAKEIQDRTSAMDEVPSFTWDGWQVLHESLAKLEAVE